MSIRFSYIIPVYNRPQEVKELLESFCELDGQDFEIIVVEDGSDVSSQSIVESFQNQFPLFYYFKENQGPGIARNYGAERAKGEWLIFLDSDTLLPVSYQNVVIAHLQGKSNPIAFGGPDRDHADFTTTQKAISFAMTSFFTTGGIRGGAKSLEKFKPRSFNMGVKADVFRELGGFSEMRFGEDVDLSLRLEQKDGEMYLIPEAFVYHKRRTDLKKFFKQVYNSGMARIALWQRHPGSLKLVHILPFAFTASISIFFLLAIVLKDFWFFLPIFSVMVLWFFAALLKSKNLLVAFTAVPASFTQLFGYGLGFFNGVINLLFKSKSTFAFRKNFYD